MALVVNDRVQQTGTANTTVSFTLSGSVTGYQSFSVIGNGNTTFYGATDTTGNWEVGIGTYATGGTLTRTTILASSNSGSAVTFSGTVNVFVTYPAEKSVNLDGSGNVSALGTIASGTWQGSTVGVAYGGTGVTTSSGANSVVLRDVNQNISFNNYVAGFAATTAAAGTTTLTVASARNQILVGSTTQTFQLPNATTLSLGQSFIFVNNSSGVLTIKDNSGATIESVPSGGVTQMGATSISTSAGSWGSYSFIPAAVDWGTNALNLASTVISGGTWNGGTIAPGYGGTGLTTFAAANNALYSTSSSALAAGTLPIAAGGTSATTASAAFNALSPITTTGDLIIGTGTNTAGRLGIGTSGYVLQSNGTTASWASPPGSSTLNIQDFTATSGQTSFTLTYTVGLVEGVYRNGIKLGQADYTATSGTAIVLGTGAITGDLIEVVYFTAVAVTNVVNTFSAGTTGFTPSTASTGAVTLAGTLNVANGGTGLTTLTAGYIPYGNGTSAFSNSANLIYNGTYLNSGAGTIQYSPKIAVRFAGNNYEFGHTNTAGYGSTLGAETGSGAPFIGFNTGAGTTGNTYKTLGLAGTVIKGDNAGGLGFYTVSNVNADNQSLSTLATLNSSGTLVASSFSGSGSSLTNIPTSIVAGTGISVSGSTGAVTITNTASAGIAGIGGQLFTSNGTFTIPTGVTLLKVTVVGGGGGSGAGGAYVGGGGGGGGGAAIKYLTGVTAGNTLAVTIGSGGTGGAYPGNNGGTGGTSQVASGTQTITTISATGGAFGTRDAFVNSGGIGGVGSNGTINLYGNGGQGGTRTNFCCSVYYYGGAGGASTLGGGGRGYADTVSTTAAAGKVYGGGASGALGLADGAAGGAGAVIFEW